MWSTVQTTRRPKRVNHAHKEYWCSARRAASCSAAHPRRYHGPWVDFGSRPACLPGRYGAAAASDRSRIAIFDVGRALELSTTRPARRCDASRSKFSCCSAPARTPACATSSRPGARPRAGRPRTARSPTRGRRGRSGKAFRVSVESSLILVPITQQAPTLWGWEAACTLVKVRAAVGAVESVRQVKGLGPTARRHGRAARSDGHPPSSREPADRWPAWRMVWHVGGDGHGADRLGLPLCCRRRAMNSGTELDSGRTSYSHERHRPSKILVYEGSRLLTESI